jgi:hypothetical protein
MTPHTNMILPVLMVLLIGFLTLPALNIFRGDARGMGHEHGQPWRSKSGVLSALSCLALTWMARIQRAFRSHPMSMIAGAALLAILGSPGLATATTEGQHAGEFLVSERLGVGYPSRENVTVLSGQNLKAGAAVGRVSLGIGRISVPAVVGTGNGTIGTVFAGPDVLVGNYVLTCTVAATNAGTFSVTNPAGKVLPTATVAVAYTSREINFTIADGSTDYIVGDVFTCVVSTTAPTVLGGTGTGTISALSLGPDARPGRYLLTCITAVTNGGVWQVFGPSGNSIGQYTQTVGSTTATAFTSRQINFTITDATDFIAGNTFEVCVFNQLNGGKVVAWDPTTFDGSHKFEGFLYDNVNASSGDLPGVIITRDAEVLKGSLQWATAITSAQKESAYKEMASRGLIAR